MVVLLLRLKQAGRMRAGDQQVLDTKHRTNQQVNNRFVMNIGRAGKRHSLFTLALHSGRKSGRFYTTPVRLVRKGQDFIIPLTNGQHSDWSQNLRAAGVIELQWQGTKYPVQYKELLKLTQTMILFPLVSRFFFKLEGVPAFVRVMVVG